MTLDQALAQTNLVNTQERCGVFLKENNTISIKNLSESGDTIQLFIDDVQKTTFSISNEIMTINQDCFPCNKINIIVCGDRS
jgi:DNA-binding transcriptional regulator YhcF (GntR family)